MSEASLKDQVTVLLHSKELMEREAKEEKRSAEQDLEEQKRASEQAQELEVERAVAKTGKELQEELNKLREEKIRLQVQLEMLWKKR